MNVALREVGLHQTVKSGGVGGPQRRFTYRPLATAGDRVNKVRSLTSLDAINSSLGSDGSAKQRLDADPREKKLATGLRVLAWEFEAPAMCSEAVDHEHADHDVDQRPDWSEGKPPGRRDHQDRAGDDANPAPNL